MAGADRPSSTSSHGPISARTPRPACTKGNRVVVTGRLQQREYETREGEKRTIIEVIADDLGPSLRWAQAQVERISRDSGDGGYGGGSSSGGGRWRRRGGAKPASDPVYGDEEPF